MRKPDPFSPGQPAPPDSPIDTTQPPTLTSQETARARSRSYALLARLYLHGMTRETLPTVLQIPALAAYAPTPPAETDNAWADEVAARHYSLFGLNVLPYQSLFLQADRLLGGAECDRVLTSYAAAGYQPAALADSPDHVGHLLGFLSFLCAAEADARQDGATAHVTTTRRLQRAALDEHLLRWLPPLALAIRGEEDAFYTALAQLTVDLVAHHHADLQQGQEAGESPGVTWDLPAAPPLLDDPQTGVREIAELLLTPCYSGFALSRSAIAALGRSVRTPRGFGDRSQMLTNLLRTAATYDQFEALLARLQDLTGQWQAGYAEMAADHAGLASVAVLWQKRAEETGRLLATLRNQARGVEPGTGRERTGG